VCGAAGAGRLQLIDMMSHVANDTPAYVARAPVSMRELCGGKCDVVEITPDRQTPATCRPAPTFRRDARAVTTRGLLEYCISRGVTFGDQMPDRGRHRERARCRNTDTNVENQTSSASAVPVLLQPSGNESARKIIIIYCNYSYFVSLSSVKFGFLFSFLLSHFVVK